VQNENIVYSESAETNITLNDESSQDEECNRDVVNSPEEAKEHDQSIEELSFQVSGDTHTELMEEVSQTSDPEATADAEDGEKLPNSVSDAEASDAVTPEADDAVAAAGSPAAKGALKSPAGSQDSLLAGDVTLDYDDSFSKD